MKKEITTALTDNFELHARQTESGIEYWLALVFSIFWGVISGGILLRLYRKAKVACKVS